MPAIRPVPDDGLLKMSDVLRLLNIGRTARLPPPAPRHRIFAVAASMEGRLNDSMLMREVLGKAGPYRPVADGGLAPPSEAGRLPQMHARSARCDSRFPRVNLGEEEQRQDAVKTPC